MTCRAAVDRTPGSTHVTLPERLAREAVWTEGYEKQDMFDGNPPSGLEELVVGAIRAALDEAKRAVLDEIAAGQRKTHDDPGPSEPLAARVAAAIEALK